MLKSEAISLMLEERGYNKNEAEKVLGKFSNLSVGEVRDLVDSTVDRKEELENYCDILEMKRMSVDWAQ